MLKLVLYDPTNLSCMSELNKTRLGVVAAPLPLLPFIAQPPHNRQGLRLPLILVQEVSIPVKANYLGTPLLTPGNTLETILERSIEGQKQE